MNVPDDLSTVEVVTLSHHQEAPHQEAPLVCDCVEVRLAMVGSISRRSEERFGGPTAAADGTILDGTLNVS